MANKFAKDFENGTNRDFGSFTPKGEPAKDMEGAKAEGGSTGSGSGSPDILNGKNTGNKTNNNSSNSSSSQNGGKSSNFNSQSSQSSDGKSQGKMAEAKQKLDNANPVKKAEQGAKADLKSSLSGRDRNEVLQEQKDKDSDPKNMAKSVAKHKAARHAGSKLGKAVGGKGLGKVAGAAAGKTTGALTGLKGLGASMLGGIKGAGAAIAATATKAGAVVAGALNVSTAVGTALVLSGTVAAATIPTAGVIGYGVSHSTQQRDGCVPEEYDDDTGSSGPEAAVEWAIKIANDDSFNYGIKGTHGDPGYANRCGCYFCGTNDKKVQLSGDERYYKTYVCMTFVTAAYAHGAKDPTALEICQRGGSFDSHDGVFEQMPNFTKVGLMKDLNVSDLQVGDVFVHYASDNSSGHMSLYAGDGRMVDASGGGFDPDSIALRGEGSAERYLRMNLGNNGGENFVMRYKGGSHQNTVSMSGSVATSTYPSGRVSRNAQDVVNGACAWAVAITEDNSFHYGYGQAAHHGGCYFCHTQPSVKHSYLDWEKSYCCNPFVYSAFAHGGGDSDMLAQCQSGHNSNTGIFTDNKHFRNLGRPSFSSLQKGDVLWYNTGSKCHYALYLGDNKLAEAGSGDDNKRNSKKWNHSIRVRDIHSYGNFTNASRYIGSGGSPMFAGALYNDEAAAMTADDGCGGEMDGAEETDAYIGKGMKKITAANGKEYIILDCDLEAVKKLGRQGNAQCYIYSIGYCDLIMGGKFRCSIEGDEDTRHENMEVTYGESAHYHGGSHNGDLGSINGTQNNFGSTNQVLEKAISEIKAGRPVIIWTEHSMSGTHFVCVCGWTADAGSKPTWNQMVCIDPAFNGTGNDGLRTIDIYPDGSSHFLATFENWTPGKGQKPRAN